MGFLVLRPFTGHLPHVGHGGASSYTDSILDPGQQWPSMNSLKVLGGLSLDILSAPMKSRASRWLQRPHDIHVPHA